jgi:microcystin-dependent protein
MPRSGSVYSLPAGSLVTNGTTSDASQHNTPLLDIAADLNAARPIASGGTGASDAPTALVNLGLTATAAELNILDGVTVTAAQINEGLAPPGSVILHAANTAPTGYLKANGALVSRSTYAALFAEIGTTHGAGDGSTTFALPDLRGEFIRGWDDGRGIDSGRAFGSAQSADIGPHTHPGSSYAQITGVNTGQGLRTDNNGNFIGTTGIDTSTGTETRPRNVALLACIKY